MKKVFTFAVTAFFIVILTMSVFAGARANLTAEPITAKSGEEQIIPVRISGNGGIMGFRIHLAYLEENIEVLEVSRGDITKKGNFNANIGLKQGGFDILWSNVNEVSGDGILFTVRIKVKTDSPVVIYTSFIQEDTFNEKYEDVFLTCTEIHSESYYEEEPTEETSDVPETVTVTPTDDMANPVISTVISNGDKNLNDSLTNTEKKEILQKVNDGISKLYGKKDYFGSFDEMKKKYKDSLKAEFAESVESLSSEKTSGETVREILKSKKIKEINGETVGAVVAELEKNGLDSKYSKALSDKELGEVLKDVLNSENANKINNKFIITVILSAVTAIIFISFLLSLLLKIKNKRKEKI